MRNMMNWTKGMVGLLAAVSAAAGFGEDEAKTVAAVKSAQVGDVRVVCADAKGWSFDAACAAADDGEVVTVSCMSPNEAQPPEFEVKFAFSGADVHHVWTTDFTKHSFTLWPSLWGAGKEYGSQLASEAPILAALNANDRAKFTMAASEAFDKVVMAMAVNERTCEIECGMKFFTQPVLPVRSYSVKIRLDRRERFWGDAVHEAADWIGRAAGFEPAHVPAAAFDPLYSTWYAYLQDVHAEPLEKEARLAASLGMKTMILDDGWQKEKSVSFYSAVGDWMPVASRFPDMKKHVAAVHAAGLKYMLWLSVPYMGDETEAWRRFKDKMLVKRGETSPGNVGVLDPRFPDVREYLIRTYERAVGEWGFDGLKLDFIDSFVLPEVDPAVAENYAGRDFKSLPLAVDRLMKDVVARLKKVNPEVLIEFRQHYMGPAIRQYGNMIRAADCPADMAFNRRRICDLRLTSGTTAVHSDMLVWSRDETPEGAARPILSALFSTIQYSMILADIRPEHKKVIRHWLEFSQAHRAALLQGRFRPHHPECGYPWIEGESAAERIVAVYSKDVCARTGAADKPVILVNATGEKGLLVEFAAPATVALFDVCGAAGETVEVSEGLCRLPVSASGYARVTWRD